MTHAQTNQQISTKKLFHVESWSVEQVIQWAKGTLTEEEASSERLVYLKQMFEMKNVNGKKLQILDLSDMSEVLSEWPLGQRVLVHKSVQDLLQFWHDIRTDTFHSLLNHTHLKLKHLLKLLDEEDNAPSRLKTTISLSYPGSTTSRREFIKATSSFVAVTYKKLINWLIRIPFIRIKRFELFRDELNAKMKQLLKIVRSKTKLTLLSGEEELRQVLREMISITSNMLNECESSTQMTTSENKDSAKLAVAFNHCVLEKIVLKKQTTNQELGISLCSLVDGVFTVGEIARHSSADDNPHINVEDDLVAVNSQIVIGWDLSSITRLLEDEFNRNRHVIILLRKMPKDNYMTIKQYRQMEEVQLLTTNRANNSSKIHLRTNDNKSDGGGEELEHQNQRKLSFSDIFIANENLEDDTSSDDNYNYEEDSDVTTDDNLNSKQYESSHHHCRNDSTKSDDNSLLLINENESSVASTNTNNVNNSDYDSEARSVYRFYEKNKRGKKIKDAGSGGDNLSAKSNTTANHGSNITGLVNNMKHLKKNARKPFIRSMQNLFIRSRSNSIESLNNNMSPNGGNSTANNEPSSSVKNSFFGLKQGTPPPMPGSIIRSLFSNAKSKQQQQGSIENLSSGSQSNPSTPNAIQTGAPTSIITSTPSSSNLPVILSSKPPLNTNTPQRGYKISSQKPTIQGWLYKEKHVKHFQTRIAYTPHFKRYWCVLVKDYIAIYKHQDDKTPKDYLLLKDFFIKTSTGDYNNPKNNIKNFFIIGDKTKQLEHEFCADTYDDYQSWLSVLTDIRMKNISGESSSKIVSITNSNSSSSLTSALSNDESTITPSKTFKSASNMPTILGSNEDMSVASLSNQTGSTTHMKRNSIGSHNPHHHHQNYSSAINTSNNNNWSRESSPGLVMAPISRDSSPSFNYPYSQEPDTSESDNDLLQNPSLIKAKNQGHLKSNNSNDSLSSTSSLAKKINKSALISASVINPVTIKSCSPSPNSASSNCQFEYTDSEIARIQNSRLPNQATQQSTTITSPTDSSHRCNSLPGSLQSCVGSYANETSRPSNNTTASPSTTYSRLYSTPSSNPPTTHTPPVVGRSNPTNIPPRHSSTSTSLASSFNRQMSSSNSPHINNYTSQVKQNQYPVYSTVKSTISSSPSVTQVKTYENQQSLSSPKMLHQQQQQPRKVSMQIEANGGILVTPVANRLPPQPSYQQQQHQSSPAPPAFMQASSSKVYRTELTILPSSPSTGSSTSANTQQVFNLTNNSQSSTSSPKYVVPSKR